MGGRQIRAPRGSTMSCKGWGQEAALRMLMNNLDPDVAEKPDELIVYGGTGRAARNWECFDALVSCLRHLESDETLLVQSGKPVGVFRTHDMAPRVLIANSMLVPAWADWDHFWEYEAEGLTMFGQMTAGSWIYIGAQGILQGTYETLAEMARQKFDGSLRGRITLTAGLGGMGGAQPLAITMNEGVGIVVEVDERRIERRLRSGYVDRRADDLAEAWNAAQRARDAGEALSIAVHGNAADTHARMVENGWIPDVVTDQTSAHDALGGYVPEELTVAEAERLREDDPEDYVERSMQSMLRHCAAMVDMLDAGAVVFDYGNNLRAQAETAGFDRARDYPGFVPAFIRPMFCEGKGPFRWAALSGDPEDILRTDQAVIDTFPENDNLRRWIRMAQQKVPFQGLPARICWLGYGERDRMGLIFNDLVRRGELKGPIVIGRDHLDAGSVASPNRETEGMKDDSDAIADWPILNALLNTAAGASWVSVHHGGGVGIGYSLHAGMVVVADGSEQADRRLRRVLVTDPGTGVARHADAGYDDAIRTARERGVRIPMRDDDRR